MPRKINVTADKKRYTKNKNDMLPELQKDAFQCPHCGTYASQKWDSPKYQEIFHEIGPSDYPEEFSRTIYYYVNKDTGRLALSTCLRCEKSCIWCDEKMVYPDINIAPSPNKDLPKNVLINYKEAASVLSRSPRAAAALLRLAIEEICVHVQCKGKTLQEKVDYLINQNKISKEIAQAMDSVRIIGNNATHPGTIDLRDNQKMVTALFKLVNFVAERLITEPREIEEFYDSLPDSKKRKKMPSE